MSNLTDFLFPKATQAQAEAGVSDSVLMTALRTKQYVDGQKGAVNGVASLGGGGRLTPGQSLSAGVEQSWQDVTSSRAFNTSYQNVTGKPISVQITVTSGSSISRTFQLQISVDNLEWVTVAQARVASTMDFMSGLVPIDHYYQITSPGAGEVLIFAELR